MIDKGFAKVRPLEGGIEAWIAKGYETTTDPPTTGGLDPRDARQKENA
jgi:3-mercaptopyruvate sulfurtransferase SseA